EILNNKNNWNSIQLIKTSKLIILLSFIWKKFIVEIERVLFKELEKEDYFDLNQLKTTFGLSNDIEDLISYINLNYNFTIRILDNKIELKNYIRNLSRGKQEFIQKFYTQISTKSIVSLSDLFKKYKTSNFEHLKLKEDIFPIIKEMISRNFFNGNIRTKKVFLAKTKFNFCLNYMLEKIIVSDTKINTERISEEKEKIEDIRNDIYNMTLKLKNIGNQIKEEIDSYLLIDEVDYAKERLKFVIRDAVMEADFLNENIENSFNEILYYTNIRAILGNEIAQWNNVYSTLQKNLVEVNSYLKSKIIEKETIRNLKRVLESLNEKLIIIEEDLKKKLDTFKKLFSETLEREYIENRFNMIIPKLNQIFDEISKYDKVIFNISQQITTKENEIVEKHRDIISKWVIIKKKYENEYKFYHEGFQFFRENLKKIIKINEKLNNDISEISEIIKDKILENQFQAAFDIIKKETDVLLNEKLTEIQNLQSIVKEKRKEKQKLYLLYKHLEDNLENLESNIIDSIAKQAQSLKDKVIVERNKTEIKDFDEFVSQEIIKLKTELARIKNKFNQSTNLKISDISKEFDLLDASLDKTNKLFSKKLTNCDKNIDNFNEKSKLTILQWEKFTSFLNNEISIQKDEYVNDIVSNRINLMAIEKKTNNINLKDLKDDVNLSCKVLIKKLKDMIDISKINGELNENDKTILIYTDFYYLNKELINYLENQLLKLNRERIGKILTLYDSSIRNLTLNNNMLELQNRISDLSVFEEILPKKFYDKVNDLQMDQERQEFLETKDYFESIIENDKNAMYQISINLNLFNSMQNSIEQQYELLKKELKEYYNIFLKESERSDSYIDTQENFKIKRQNIREKLRQTEISIEDAIRKVLNKTEGSNKLIPEIREIFVRKKNGFLEEFNGRMEKIGEQIELMKNESFREKLIDFINTSKIKLSQFFPFYR
ncbi:MAG: hypothetical protein ACFFG0_51385, partial [Candidatus Thorarchaeota archaeon]